MTQSVQLFVILSRRRTVFLCRNDGLHALRYRLPYNVIGIVTFVCQQILRRQAFYQCTSLSTICCCTFCNNSPDRHTMRIHGQMQFCVEPPFVRLLS